MTDQKLPDLPVGWIGTGRMGAAMARRLARAGADLTVWNRTRAKAEALVPDGARVAESLGELAGCHLVFTMVSASADLEAVLTGPGGLLDGRGQGGGAGAGAGAGAGEGSVPSIIVDCSTVSTGTSAAMRAAAADRGVAFLAAPVSGNGKVAAAGRLSLVVSGPEETYLRAEPFLRTIAAAVTYAGEGEVARLVKICHNLLLGVLTQSLAEIAVLAERGGVSRAALLEFVNGSVLGSTFTRYKTPAFVHLDYTPTFTPVLLRKDLDLGLAAARELGVPMPLAAATQQLVQSAISTGRGAEDFAVLLDLQAASAGLRLEPEAAQVDDGLG
jgi:3-hydroxyisobutyrate dehydrogenase